VALLGAVWALAGSGVRAQDVVLREPDEAVRLSRATADRPSPSHVEVHRAGNSVPWLSRATADRPSPSEGGADARDEARDGDEGERPARRAVAGSRGPDPSPAAVIPPPAQTAGTGARQTGLARWIDVPAATLSTRYRFIGPTTGPNTNQVQAQEVLRVRLKVDPRARLSLTTGWQTGGVFTSGWDSTGIGTGSRDWDFQMRQLFLSVAPAAGVQISYGGLGIERGQATEITSYDNDGYCVGARAIVTRRGWPGPDEVVVTVGYLGDVQRPNVFERLRRLDETNYQQVLVGRQVGEAATVSLELTRHEGVETVRSAARISTRPLRVADAVRLEGYVRMAGAVRSGFALTAERRLASRLEARLGFASIDRAHDRLNADRFGRGRRVFGTLDAALTPVLRVQVFAQHSAGTPYPIPNRRRLDVILTYNAAPHLRRLGLP
jgi:hypothetical protein